MQVDWDKTINEILSSKLTCQACQALGDEMIVGYTREPEAAQFAMRCRDCEDKSDCDARKLVIVCEDCARRYRVNGSLMDEVGMMSMMLDECRRSLEESIEYVAAGWKEDADIPYEDMAKPIQEVLPDVFREEDSWRLRLEEEYLQIHRWFREHKVRIPDPGWRSQYVEDAIELGLVTNLGD
ncbi:MAG: hypothetical protein Kow0010_26000 [Dehalococcoidia bacterium]